MIPKETIESLAKIGLLGLSIPKEYGGKGVSQYGYCKAIEEVSSRCGSTAIFINAHQSIGIKAILLFGNSAQKKQFLPSLAKGEKIAAFSLTEPNAGSDAAAIESTAVRRGDSYILNGSKCFISNFTVASVALIMAKTDTTVKPSKGITAFMVDKNPNGDTPGLVDVKVMPKWSMLAIPTCEFRMENLEVPPENVLGNEGDGFKIALASLDRARIATAAHAIGVAQGAIDECVEYAKTRTAFGQKIGFFHRFLLRNQ